ncbi:hypothetical protein Ndes2526B_g06928 [Nannochloris sp. 'desiccata']
MRQREYRSKTDQERARRSGERSAARADVLASQDTRPMLSDLPSSANPRILFEDFDGDRFIAEPVEPYVSQAMDIIEAFDKAWFGVKQRNGFGSRSNVSSGSLRPPALPAHRPHGRRFRRHPQHPLAPPPVGTTTTSPPEQMNNHYNSNQQQQGLKNGLEWNNQSISTNPISATITPEQQRQQQILQELPGIGTWAGRQRLFSVRPLPQMPHSQVEDDLLAIEAEESCSCSSSSSGLKNHNVAAVAVADGDASTSTAAVNTENGHGYSYEKDDPLSDGRVHNGCTTTRSEEDVEKEETAELRFPLNGANDVSRVDDEFNDAVITTLPVTRTILQRTTSNTSSEARHIAAAWKWRFTRKWQAEQQRVLEADPTAIGAEGDGGDDLDALEYLHACGMGLDLQMLAGDVQQRRRRKRHSGEQGRGGNTRGGGRGNLINNAAITAGASSTTLLNNGANGRIKSGIINAPEPSRVSDMALLTSLRRDASSVSTATMQFDVEPSYASIGDLLSCEGSENIVGSYLMTPDAGAGLGSNPAAATRDLLSVVVRGRELLQRQTELEREAAAKWEEIERNCCGGASTWAGNVVPPVDIAMHGKFCFVVLRMLEIGGGGGGGGGSSVYQLTDGIDNAHGGMNFDGVINRSGSMGANRQRMLVRGRPKATPQELLEETIAHASTACAQKNLPYVSISIVGAGEMEWREDTDRHLMVSPAPKYLNMKIKSMGRSSGGGVSGGGVPTRHSNR